MKNPFKPIARRFARIRKECRAVATIEFAMILPVFMTLGLTGVEVAYMLTVNMQVSQAALSLADNASRLGQTDNSSVTPTVTEADIDSIMSGAVRQGASYDLEDNGRIILSSLEFDSVTGKQFIHWQRCRGDLDQDSSYGDDGQNNGLGSTIIPGVGVADDQIQAGEGTAIMVAEIYYQYDGLMGEALGESALFREEAIFAIRDDRNLTPGVTGGGGDSSCS